MRKQKQADIRSTNAKLLSLKNKANNEEGFTLIELMIVVVIIGILAAIAIPVFANQQKAAIIASIKSDVRNTNANIVNYLTKHPTAGSAELSNRKKGVGVAEGAVSSGTFEVVVTGDDTTVAVWGNWNDYSMRVWNSTVDANATLMVAGANDVRYSSLTGKLT